ncbi:YeeE/YedE family protein [Sulfurimonas sp. MAG313]|nr:YeeE/YedE family protein [Sulfurimonas sp. MAG313]MDF1880860.1 YeeE/YedE family protein [Sulfurimonas sp. MAG313]
MLDSWDIELYQIVNIFALFIGFCYGLIAQKTQFCFNGSIKDYILDKSTRRLGSVLSAIIVAIISSQLLSYAYDIDLYQSIYLQTDINYFLIIFGGILFGIGMMQADGCSSRHLVKFAQGDLHSLVTLVSIGIFGYMTSRGVLSYPLNFLKTNETLVQLSGYIPNQAMPMWLILTFFAVVLWRVLPNLKNLLLTSDGVLIGLLIGASWFVTGYIGFDEFEGVPVEALSFVFPTGKTLEYLMFFSGSTLSFSVCVVFGVLLGSFLMSKFNKKYRFSCAPPPKNNKLQTRIWGGALMGIGGILSYGCTIGQGLSGISTLALASLISISSIYISAFYMAKYMAKKDTLPSCFSFDWQI